jgi:glycosyltransferase involved in cell wall biosynthesis
MQNGQSSELGRAEQGRPDQNRRVRILLATYNGRRFLDPQLRSLAAQTWPEIDVLASDDGSTDGTLEMLRQWPKRWTKGEFRVIAGPRGGFVENFRTLMTREEMSDGFVAFCDQDDEWDPDKLDVAIARLGKVPEARPSLYSARTRYVAEDGTPIGLSPLFRRPPSFRNAIVQNIGGGNTMVMNRSAFVALSESARRTGFVMHDWWSYILVSGMGGVVIYDPVPHVSYRQHERNLVGHHLGLRSKMRRFRRLLAKQSSRWNSSNLAALGQCEDLLTEESRVIVREFARARTLHFPANIAALSSIGVYRQNPADHFAFMFAAAIGYM